VVAPYGAQHSNGTNKFVLTLVSHVEFSLKNAIRFMRDDSGLPPTTKQAQGSHQAVKEENYEGDQRPQCDCIVDDLSGGEYVCPNIYRIVQLCCGARTDYDEFTCQQQKIKGDNARNIRG
jgi:hypothetical protein